jgi:hypothetical protein
VLMTVASFTEPWEAHLLRLRLQAEGICAVVAHEHLVWTIWPWALAVGGVQVLVLAEAWAQARAIATRCRAGGYSAELEQLFGPLDDDRCPRCGSTNFKSRRSLPMLMILLVGYFFAGAIFPLRASVHRCTACATKWRDRDRASSAEKSD